MVSLPDSLTVYVLAVLFVATLIRSTLGFGEALIAVPLLALRMSVAVATPLAVMVSVLGPGRAIVCRRQRSLLDQRGAGDGSDLRGRIERRLV